MPFIVMLFFNTFCPVMSSVIYQETHLKQMKHSYIRSNIYPIDSWPDYQCWKISDCQCKKTSIGFFYHCEMLLFAEMDFTTLKVYCNHTVRRENVTEKIHRLSDIAQDYKSLTMYDCPVDSISDFLHLAQISKLELHCEERKDFNLTMDVFRNLSSLKHITISCGSLIRLPKGIFRTQTPILKSLLIKNTMINRLDADILSNHSKLGWLQFKNNTILKLSKTNFMGLENLYLLEINKYPSVELEENLFDPIPNISKLIISESGFKKFPTSFQRLQKLEFLTIKQTSLEWIDEDDCKSLMQIIDLIIINNPFLDMHPNCLTYLNDTARLINIFGNQISNLPIQTVKMKRLRFFEFCDNDRDIQTVKYFISSYTLCFLSMRNSSIHSIHEDFLRYVPHLQEINLSDNKLSYLNESFFEKNINLDRVNLSGNSLTSIPVSLFNKKPLLISVDLSHNNISEINFNLTENLTSLKYLNLSYNKIQLLPRNPFSSMPNIEFLDISNNNISVIDSSALQVMANLSELRMGGNKMKGIFFPFSNTFKSLKSLSADSNSFTEIVWLNMPSLLRLNLANNLIEDFYYKAFDQCKDMVELNLSRNRIEMLPEEIPNTQLTMLISLDLSFNRLKIISYVHFQKMQLKFLDLSGNNMKNFDLSWISYSKGIRKVSIRSNNISVLYCSFSPDEHILVLDLSYNRISSKIWPWYYDKQLKSSGRISPFVILDYLEELYLAHNEITDIPIDFRIHHPHLKILDLSFNKIKRLSHYELLFYWYRDAEPYDIGHSLTVDLRNNLIRSVDLPHSMLLRNVTRKCERHKYSHATILLGHNPFECGCRVIPFLRVAEEDVVLTSEIWRSKGKDWLLQARINTDSLTCSYPESVNGKLVVATETWMHHLLPTMGFCQLSEDKDYIDYK